ncbi:hypothetical protein FSP39_003263 [Pinctada imbricata]|uniref:LRAT domain-containing protein n=1 Tax=Pinctada imbricata TaxID=66713 RepID=A0AA88Y2V1_PINIB|nr:hypothetical protein FSP39_003263 [Pinctada imbricata]
MEFSSSCIECAKPYPVIKRDELAEGDHIINAGTFYDDHAIVIKIEPDVRDRSNLQKARVVLIHATTYPLGISIGTIRQTVDYFDFKRCNIMIVKYFNRPFTSEEIIHRAKIQLGMPIIFPFMNSCEYFATHCVTNKIFSVQGRKWNMNLKIFFFHGLDGLSDEKLRNQVAHERELICKPCFERNNELFGVKKKAIRKEYDVHEGDIITFSYWKIHHDAIVMKVHENQTRNMKGVDLTFAHYAFCGPFISRTIIEERKTFPLDGSVIVNLYKSPQFNVYSPTETTARAKMRIGEQNFALFLNDSCNFARWCKLKPESLFPVNKSRFEKNVKNIAVNVIDT